jgi:biotin carboxylase
MSRILILAPATSYRLSPYLSAAARLGAQALVASPGAQALVGAPAIGIGIDPDDPAAALAAILDQVARTPVDAVVATDDRVVELAARVAQQLALPHNPPDAAVASRRKDLARERLRAHGVPAPRFTRIDLKAPLAAQAETVSYPCVLKPLAMSGSRGVIRADDPGEFMRAVARIGLIVRHEPDEEEQRYLLAEEFIPGFEIAVEGMLTGGRLDVLAVFDKPDPLDGPYFEETYYVTPSRLDGEIRKRACTTVAEACHAYGLREGPVHAELRVNERGSWVIEVAARTIGGMCARLLRFGTGMGLEELVLRQALGLPVPKSAEAGGAGVLMIPIPQAGILRRVEGLLAAQQVPFIEEVRIDVRDGYELVPLPEGDAYLGFVFARAPTPRQAEDALRQAHACLRVVVAPLWKVETAA